GGRGPPGCPSGPRRGPSPPAAPAGASPPWQSMQPRRTEGDACMLLASLWEWQVTQPALLRSASSCDCVESGDTGAWARVDRPTKRAPAATATANGRTTRRRTMGPLVGQLHVQEQVPEILALRSAARDAADRGVDVVEPAGGNEARGPGRDRDVLVQQGPVDEAAAEVEADGLPDPRL